MVEHNIGSVPLELELSILAERMVFLLSQKGELTENAKVVLHKADEFLDSVLRGQETVRFLRLPTSSGDIPAYRWGLQACKEIVEREEISPREFFLRARLGVQGLLSGSWDFPDGSRVEELSEFFRKVMVKTTNAIAQPVEKVSIPW